MKSKFLTLYNLVMEQLQNIRNYKYENITIAIVPGSFKPPHKGHWEMIMNYVNQADKVVVLISNISTSVISSRALSLSNLKEFGAIKSKYDSIKDKSNIPGVVNTTFNEIAAKSDNISFNELLEKLQIILNVDSLELSEIKSKIQKYIDKLNKSLFTSIRKTSDNTEITPEMSKEIFEIFASASHVQNKVEIQISKSASPVTATYELVNNDCMNCKVLLGVSKKGGDESKWAGLKQSEENPTNKIVVTPVDVKTMLSATQLRNEINNLHRDWFPDDISDEDFEKIKGILTNGK